LRRFRSLAAEWGGSSKAAFGARSASAAVTLSLIDAN